MTERSGRVLWLYGGGMLVVALYFAWQYPLLANSSHLVDIGILSHYGAVAFALFAGGMLLWLALYVLAIREVRRLPARTAFPPVFGCGTALAAVMASMYPVTGIDTFIYAVHSRLFTTYGVNPARAMPNQYPHDAWLGFASQQWAEFESPYGPLWTLIAAPITWLAGNRIAIALIGFKILALLCVLTGTAVIARLLLYTRPADAATGALLYLWSPLVLWEGLGNGHNDVVMTLPVLLALLAWTRHHDLLVIPLLVVATAIKYMPLVLIPIAAVALWRRAADGPARTRLLVGTLGLSALVVLVAGYPFYDVSAILTGFQHHNYIRLSPDAVAFSLLAKHYPRPLLRTWIQVFAASGMVVTLAYQSVVLWKHPAHLPRVMFEAVFVLLVIARPNFTAWYLIWPVALAALLPWGWPAWRMLGWSAGALLQYGLLIWIGAWWHVGFVPVHHLAVLMMFGPALALTAAELRRRSIARHWSNSMDSSTGA